MTAPSLITAQPIIFTGTRSLNDNFTLNVNHNGNTATGMVIPVAPSPVGMTTFNSTIATAPSTIINISTIANSNAAGFYLVRFLLAGGLNGNITQSNAFNLGYLNLNIENIDLDNPSPTQIMNILPPNSFRLISLSGIKTLTSENLNFDLSTGNITITKAGLTAGTPLQISLDGTFLASIEPNIVFPFNVTTNIPVIGNTIPPPPPPPPVIPPPPSTPISTGSTTPLIFLGGNFSTELCTIFKGDIQKTIITGKAENPNTIYSNFISSISNIIRSRDMPDYKDPSLPLDLSIFFTSDFTPSYPYEFRLQMTTFLMLGAPNNITEPAQVKIVTDIVKVYFKMMRDFLKNFYSNSSIVSSDCFDTSEKPSFITSGSDCHSSLKIIMSRL